MRFFRDRPDLTPVRWYFVPEGTPWIPHPHRFLSPDWETDPKGNVEAGCSWEITQPWVNGSLPPGHQPAQAGDRPCGPADIWRHGQPTHTMNPPVDWAGVPLCCPRHLPQPAPLIHLRPEELVGIPDGTTINSWPSAPGTVLPAAPAFGDDLPLKQDGRAVVRTRYGPPGPANHEGGFIIPAMLAPFPGAVTIYLVSELGTGSVLTGALLGPVPGNGIPAISSSLTQVRLGTKLAQIPHTFAGYPHLVRISGNNTGEVGLWVNGVFHSSTMGWPRTFFHPGLIRPNGIALLLGQFHTVPIWELLTLPYWVTEQEEETRLAYFKDRYPFIP